MAIEEDRSKRSLADDPSFLASLSDLDRGLSDLDAALRMTPEPQPPPPTPQPVAPLALPAPASGTSPSPTIGRRRLLDLFPPVPEHRPAVRSTEPRFEELGDLFSPAPERRPVVRSTDPRVKELSGLFSPALERRPAASIDDLQPPPVRPRRSQPAAPVDTPTYATFYGLNEKPFSLSSDPKFLYHSASHDRATQRMLGAIRRREAMVVLTGEIGVGKTTLCRGVIEQLDRRTLTSFVVDPFESAEDLLKTVLIDFGVISRDDLARGRLTNASRADLAAVLRDFLFSLAPLQAFAVVFIDEAQNLPVDLLAQMRVLADTEGDARLLQVVLIGQPNLLTTLARPELRQFAQRISVRCTLEPLAGDEIAGYVMNRLAVAGGSLRVEFDDGSLERVYELSAGVPRLVNLLCDRALSVGYGLSASVIDVRVVESAAEDLDLDPPSGISAARLTAAIVALMLLVLLGAGGAAFVFRARLSAVVTEWQSTPPAPPGPGLALPAPYAPMPAVDADKLPSSA